MKKLKKTERRKGKKPIKKIIICIAAAAVVIAGVAAFASGKTGNEEEPEQTTAEATVMTIEKTLSSDAEVISSLEENLSPHTGYYLEKVKVEAGDAVDEGDTILTYTNGYKMTAPYNCVIKSWSLPDEEDQLTTDHYIAVAGTDVLQMELSVDEDEVSLIKTGDSASVQISATGGTFDGVVTSVSEQGDYSDSGSTFAAKVTFDNDGTVKLGMSGTATISLDKAENAVAVPVNAVTRNRNESVVTVQKKDGTTEEVTVETGISNDAFIEIKSGLEEGETVVVPVSDDSSSENGFMQMPGGGMPNTNGASGGGDTPPSGSGIPPGGGNQQPSGGGSAPNKAQ